MVIFKAGFKTDKGQGTRLGSKIICSSSEHSQGAHTKIYITLFSETLHCQKNHSNSFMVSRI